MSKIRPLSPFKSRYQSPPPLPHALELRTCVYLADRLTAGILLKEEVKGEGGMLQGEVRTNLEEGNRGKELY